MLVKAIEHAIVFSYRKKNRKLENDDDCFGSIILMCLIVIVELWQSNKRLKRMLEQDKTKWRDCSMKTSR